MFHQIIICLYQNATILQILHEFEFIFHFSKDSVRQRCAYVDRVNCNKDRHISPHLPNSWSVTFWSPFGRSEGIYIDGDAAVDGIARVNKVEAEPLEGLDGYTTAKIEVVDTAARSDGICMIYGD